LYEISEAEAPFRISGRSDMVSRTVMVRYGPELNLVMLLTNFLSSTTTLSWQARGANTCRGSGKRGSFSPGAAARMMARLRVWATPYCPACSTPKVHWYPMRTRQRSVSFSTMERLKDTKFRTFSRRK
jgi:hypothetical protein